MRLTHYIAFICLVLFLSESIQAREWRGIVPLVSTRSEVEQLLGKRPKNSGATYNFPTETVHVYYATLSCEEWPQPPRGWNVPKDTVIRVFVYPKTRELLRLLGIELQNFKREQPSSCLPQDVHYVHEEDGFAIQTMELGENNETVFSYHYYPTAEQTRRLGCPIQSKTF